MDGDWAVLAKLFLSVPIPAVDRDWAVLAKLFLSGPIPAVDRDWAVLAKLFLSGPIPAVDRDWAVLAKLFLSVPIPAVDRDWAVLAKLFLGLVYLTNEVDETFAGLRDALLWPVRELELSYRPRLTVLETHRQTVVRRENQRYSRCGTVIFTKWHFDAI